MSDTPQTSVLPPTFGVMLRGARLGWRWSPKHGGFVRLAVAGDQSVLVQLHPPTLMPSRCALKKYWCWWDAPSVLDLIPQLTMIRRVKRPIAFEVAI